MNETPHSRPILKQSESRRNWKLCLTTILSLLFIANVWSVPPPTVDTPLYDCSEWVYIRSYDSGARLRVYVNNSIDGNKLGATGSGTWVSINPPLQGGDKVEVTQEISWDREQPLSRCLCSGSESGAIDPF